MSSFDVLFCIIFALNSPSNRIFLELSRKDDGNDAKTSRASLHFDESLPTRNPYRAFALQNWTSHSKHRPLSISFSALHRFISPISSLQLKQSSFRNSWYPPFTPSISPWAKPVKTQVFCLLYSVMNHLDGKRFYHFSHCLQLRNHR
jgi:hypothetical protein